MRLNWIRGCVAAALLVGIAAPTQAQGIFGRIADKAASAAAKKAGVGAKEPRAGNPTFTGDVLEITDARVQQLVAGLEAEAALRPQVEREYAAQMERYQAAVAAHEGKMAQWERDNAAWRKRKEAWDACMAAERDKAQKEEENSAEYKQAQANEAALNDEAFKAKLEARLQELAGRMQAAQARGDQKTMMAINDTIQRELAPLMQMGRDGAAAAQRVSARSEARQKAMAAKCGADPGDGPEMPDSPNDLFPKAGAERLVEAGAKAAKLTTRQYAVLKERVGAYLAMKKRGDGNSGSYVFSAAELAVLGSSGPTLQGHVSGLDNY